MAAKQPKRVRRNTSIRNISIELPYQTVQDAVIQAKSGTGKGVRIPLLFRTQQGKTHLGEVIILPPSSSN